MAGATFQIIWHRYGRGSLELDRSSVALLPQPFQQHIATEREADSHEWLGRVIPNDPAHHQVQIGRLAGVIEPRNARNLAIAATKDENVGGPSAAARLIEHSLEVMRPNGALESVEHQQARYVWCAASGWIEAADLDLVAIGCSPPFDACGDSAWTSRQLAPERLEMRARYPPRGGIGILAGVSHDRAKDRGRGPSAPF
jgi:hypothetical protein